jgi:hypothetical protein
MEAELGESAKAQVMPVEWRHLIRRPAKLTGTRHELCGGEPIRPGVGSLTKPQALHPVR